MTVRQQELADSSVTRRAFAAWATSAAVLVAAPSEQKLWNGMVFKQEGLYGGWPANHGIWSWGDEVVVGFSAAHYLYKPKGHAADFDKPVLDWQARSQDAGRTWSIERPPVLQIPKNGGPEPRPLEHPLDFTHADFALMFRHTDYHVGPSRFYQSTDRCQTWQGPYSFQVQGIDKIAARTDYTVLGKRECLMFGTAGKANNREGKAFCARTVDGGLTWKLIAVIGGEEPEGYNIMPSTVMVAPRQYVTTIRRKDHNQPAGIDCYRSDDDGKTWSLISVAAEAIGIGNPPSLLKLKDGRLCVVYGYRLPPYGIRAKLSADNGETWSDDIILRDDSPTEDLGYPRSVQLPDGKILSTYYFNGPKHSDRAIEATIWTP